MIFGSGGRAYGLELFIQKKTGKLTGWIESHPEAALNAHLPI